MRVALIALLDDEDGKAGCLEAEHTLALASRMRDCGRLAPMIITQACSRLAASAREMEFPLLEIKKSSGIMTLFKIWRWQKKHKYLLILAIGQKSMPLGCRLLGMRGKGSAELDFCFFLRPPDISKNFCKFFIRGTHCLCGSGFILGRTRSGCDGQPIPEMIVCQPGMNMENFNFSIPEYTKDDFSRGRHFVFGMAESLVPRSGALVVARAMAALWQKSDLPPWEVRMFGSGPRFQEILAEAENLGVANRLSILCDQPLDEVSRHCHAWLAPGISPEELPEDLWAGFAAGLPVICAKSELHEERLEIAQTDAALRVDGTNPQELASAMISLAGDPVLRKNLVARDAAFLPVIGLNAMADRVCGYLEDWGAKAGFDRSEKGDTDKERKK